MVSPLRCCCGSRERSPVAAVAASPVPLQMWDWQCSVYPRFSFQVLGATLGVNANIQKTSIGFTGFVCLLRCNSKRHFNRAICSLFP